MSTIKNIFVKLSFAIRDFIYIILGVYATKKYFHSTNLPRVFLMGTPEHDNMGDHAIALSEIDFIKKHYPKYKIVEITVESWKKYKWNLKRYVTNNDMFFMTGGGNMGDIYVLDEELRRYVISNFKNNKVVIFPQTIYFTQTHRGIKELKKTISIYKAHPRLLICAREEISYNLMTEYFGKDKVFLCPDMVFDWDIEIYARSSSIYDVGLCLRDDCEKSKIKEFINIEQLKKDFKVLEFNTCHTSGIAKEERTEYLSKLIKTISANKVIITDRLHCLIIASKLGVPCIVSAGDSHKIKSTLKWLNLPKKIKYISPKDDLYQLISVLQSECCETFRIEFDKYFNELYERTKRL